MEVRIYNIERHIGGCVYEIEDCSTNFKDAVETLDHHRDCARKSESRHKYVYRLVKRVETVYDV
jgi:hypothetical protein